MDEPSLQLPRSSLLSPRLRLAWFWLLLTAWGTLRQLFPRWRNQSCVGQCPLTLDYALGTQDRVVSLQLSDHQPCGARVSLFDHSGESAQFVQFAAARTRTALASPNPPADNDWVENTCAAAEAFGVPKISRRHAQTFSSWGLAIFCVFRPDRPQPDVRPCGATHGEEEKRSAPKTPAQSAQWECQGPSLPCWAASKQQQKISPNHSFGFQLRVSALSQPWSPQSQERHHVFARPHPLMDGFEGSLLTPKANNNGMTPGVAALLTTPLLPLLPLVGCPGLCPSRRGKHFHDVHDIQRGESVLLNTVDSDLCRDGQICH